MTDKERQELRDWSARLMGWRLNSPDAACPNLWWGDDHGGHIIDYFDWTPDLASAPVSQFLSVIDAMRERGYKGHLDMSWDKGFGFAFLPLNYTEPKIKSVYADTFLDAVLLAAKDTVDRLLVVFGSGWRR